MNKIIGIDPGKSGAFWELSKLGETGYWIDMPFKKNGICEKSIIEYMKKYNPQTTLVALEQPFYSPKMRGTSGYKFGIYYGIVKGIVIGMGFTVKDIRPVVWKRFFSLISRKENKITKQHSIKRAASLNPKFRSKFSYTRTLVRRKGVLTGTKYTQTVSKDGRAEAYLIAEYGRRNFLIENYPNENEKEN